MCVGRKVSQHPPQFGAFLRGARNSRMLSLEDAAAQLGSTADDLRSVEESRSRRLHRGELVALAAGYGLPSDAVVDAAGGAPCSVPEADDFAGGGAASYCVCGWSLSEHSAADLATALWHATRMLWHPRAWPDPVEGAERLQQYRDGLVELADDPAGALQELSRRNSKTGARRPLVDLLQVIE